MRYASIEEMEEALLAASRIEPTPMTPALMEKWRDARARAENAADCYGELMSEVFDVVCDPAELQLGFGGLLVGISLHKGQTPHPIVNTIDTEGDWDYE